jgi:hypothetical protein
MNSDKIFGITAAAISILGTFVIWNDAQEVNKKTTELLLEVASKIGIWVDNPLSKEKLEEMRMRERKSSHLNIRGFVLLIIGFIVQLISFFL